MSKKFPFYSQLDQMDCGPTCLRMVSKFFGKNYSIQTLRDKSQIGRDGVSLLGLANAAEAIGLKSTGLKVTSENLIQDVPLPCILHWRQNHFVVLYKVEKPLIGLSREKLKRIWGGRGDTVPDEKISPSDPEHFGVAPLEKSSTHKVIYHLADPAKGLISYSRKDFEQYWLSGRDASGSNGMVLVLQPSPRFLSEDDEQVQQVNLNELVGYLWQYRRLIFQLGLAVVVSSMFALLFPFLTQSIVDIGISTQNLSFVQLVAIAQLVLVLSSASIDFLRGWILLHISSRLNLTILSSFLAKLMRLPVSFFDIKQFGDIMQRIGDHSRIESFLTGQALGTLLSLFNLLVFGCLLAIYHQEIFLVTVISSSLYAIWISFFFKQRGKLDMTRFEISSRNQGHVVQLIQGMQDIKLAGAETLKRWEWESIQAKLFKWSIKSLSLAQFQQGGALVINQTKNVLITLLSAQAVIKGDLTLGQMMSIQYVLGQFNAPIEQLIGLLKSWQDAQISLERLNEIHKLADEESYGEDRRQTWDIEQDIVISNLTFAYSGAGNEPVLKNINLKIPNGKTTAIVGTSGSGKTTLLKMLLRHYEPLQGEILLSQDPKSLRIDLAKTELKKLSINTTLSGTLNLRYISHKAWRKACGVVMQDGFIFSDTIARNIALGEDVIDRDRLYDAARVANIHEFIESLPLGYYTKIGIEGNGISQGQRQRILIARSVYKQPHILLFDEATNALDANNEAKIVSNLREFFKDRTVVVVAHRLSTVRHADQIVVMEKGEIVEIGNHSELVEQRSKYFELVSNQLELAV